MSDRIEEVGRLLKHAKRVLFITGAGVSAESGIPTFRGVSAAFEDGRTEEGIPFEEVLSRRTFLHDPALSWKYFYKLEEAFRGKQPNAAHKVIAALQTDERYVCVATQNIDGLHQRAGSQHVVELHGDLLRIICTACEYKKEVSNFAGWPQLPSCPKCGEVLRPDIVLYEEAIPEQALFSLQHEQMAGFDVVFSVGTTSLFQYVIQPVTTAVDKGIPVVEINPEETMISDLADFRFAEPAGKVLLALQAAARE
jgi:NAD-dependent deacetylase